MGEETTQFASRFSNAVAFLAALAGGGKAADAGGDDLAAAVRGALDAIEAVYETETSAVRDWPEQRRRVLAQLAGTREALESSGVGEEVRRQALALVLLVDPGNATAERAPPRRPRGG